MVSPSPGRPRLVEKISSGFFKLSSQVGGKGQVEGGRGFLVFAPPAFHLSQAFGFREARFWLTIINSFGP